MMLSTGKTLPFSVKSVSENHTSLNNIKELYMCVKWCQTGMYVITSPYGKWRLVGHSLRRLADDIVGLRVRVKGVEGTGNALTVKLVRL